MINVVVLVSGGGTNLQALIDKIDDGTVTNARISAVISNKQDAYALERAAKHSIPSEYISPKEYNDRDEFADAMLDALIKYKADLIVLAGYLVIIPAKLISTYEGRIINIHPSLIPSHCGPGFYGLKVHESVLARGNRVTGATVHFVDDGTDTGPIILQEAVRVECGDTPEILQKRVMEQAEWVILPKAVDLYANGKLTIINNQVIISD